MRIVFAGGGTGGHLYPGLAIARVVQRLRPDIEPFFIGAQRGIEREVLPTTPFPHVLLDLHPLYRSRIWNNWRTIVGLISAWRGIGRVFRERRPAVVVGTGGYAAGAALAYAITHRIPMVEQTGDSVPSLTARVFAPWAREIYLAFPESAKHFRADEAPTPALVETGAPIDPPPEPRPPREAALQAWGFPPDATVVLVYGGSQGALAVNEAVRDWVGAGLSGRVHVIWGTGKAHYDRFRGCESDRVRVRPFLAPIADAYAAADVAVSRAGTMTLAELMAWRIPAVLIPLPTAAADHQTHNARALEQAGAAIHLRQADLTGVRLGKQVTALLEDRTRLSAMAAAAAARARPHAAEEIARRIIAIADSTAAKAR